MSSRAAFVEINHTADWSIRVNGATLPELFINAATGMYSLMANVATITPTIKHKIEISSVDSEALLVKWLNELLYHTEMDGEVFCEFAIHSFEPTHLSSTARAGRGGNLKKHIKAVTFHNLSIVATGDGYEVTLVFDV